MTDQPWPGHRDRRVQIVHVPSLNPYFPFALWCGTCHRIINTYETPIGAALFAHRHLDHGGHRTMEPQTITDDAVREALVEWIAEQTGETAPVSVILHAAGDALVVTYRHGDVPSRADGLPAEYAALILDSEIRALIDAHVEGVRRG